MDINLGDWRITKLQKVILVISGVILVLMSFKDIDLQPSNFHLMSFIWGVIFFLTASHRGASRDKPE